MTNCISNQSTILFSECSWILPWILPLILPLILPSVLLLSIANLALASDGLLDVFFIFLHKLPMQHSFSFGHVEILQKLEVILEVILEVSSLNIPNPKLQEIVLSRAQISESLNICVTNLTQNDVFDRFVGPFDFLQQTILCKFGVPT